MAAHWYSILHFRYRVKTESVPGIQERNAQTTQPALAQPVASEEAEKEDEVESKQLEKELEEAMETAVELVLQLMMRKMQPMLMKAKTSNLQRLQ